MVSPVNVGLTATTVALANTSRRSIRFQNVGATIIYLKKNELNGTLVSPFDYEVLLAPLAALVESSESYTSESMHSFSAISIGACGQLAIFETNVI